MAIDSKFSVSEILAISTANHEAIESKEFSWKTMVYNTREYFEKVETILEERCEEVRESYDLAREGEQKDLEEEWIALVIAKDKNLRQKIEKENEQIKNQYMQQLHHALQALGTFGFSEPREAVLRRNMAKMFQQVEKYCTRNNIDIEAKHPKSGCTCTVSNQITSMAAPVPPPPPPPPPPIALFCQRKSPNKMVNSNQSKTPKRFKVPRTGNSLTTYEERTPLRSLNNELLSSIKHGRAKELRSTPCKRSPGGTPRKRQRRLSENDTSDLITLALRKKFKNAIVCSPSEICSPNVQSPSSEYL